ncbi:MAG TPA: Lrp/AsnC family transcriptional regulator, partial [Thermoplasmatales archaeon]|nr:Lrp/AsnC family transcriptional regulator [Thermoplasmatales archaeon]
MVVGFALIKNKPGTEFWVHSRLLNEPEIKEVYPLFGAYSFLVKIEADSIDSIGRIVLKKIRSIRGV